MTSDFRVPGAMTRRTLLKRASALVAASAVMDRAAWAAAEEWPARPVTLVVPYAAGGNSDMMARLLGRYLGEKTGKPFVVDNRAGGAGVPASMAVVGAQPDGCTVMFGPSAPLVITPVMEKVSYDADSFTPINNFATYPYMIGVKASLPVRNMAELIAYAKANPGKLNYASAGAGSLSHLLTAMLAAKANIDLMHIPYKGSAPATTALVAGEVDICLTGVSDLMPYFSGSDKVRVIATTAPSRVSDFSQIPTVNETVQGYAAETWNGIVGPKGVPKPVVDKFAALIREVVAMPEVVTKLKQVGILPAATTTAAFSKTIADDRVFYREAIKVAGVL
jgi:tripartite-type tricarboxylate transporter receptor subunit TctC